MLINQSEQEDGSRQHPVRRLGACKTAPAIRLGVVMAGICGLFGPQPSAAQGLSLTAEIEEIVVTARKREEALKAVPQAITVLSHDDLQRFEVKTSPELAQQTPNLMWHSALGFASPNIFLRGIGNTTFNANQANPVGIYVDSAYQGSNIAYGFGLFDLERVEILKGASRDSLWPEYNGRCY